MSTATMDLEDNPTSAQMVDEREVLIDVRDLRKTFQTGLFPRRVDAVRGVSFQVRRGEIFGFLGPNGAGKTTTIKMLTGLIMPSGGQAFLFGEQVPSPQTRQRIGFLPENPYVYPYLTPREFVDMCGRLSGMRGQALRQRITAVLEQVKIAYAADRQVRRLSKGMLQRVGLAAALVSDPEMLILDEPMSGLDPVGRKEVRDLIFEERHKGRTIFFSTHILSDVEAMCDRVAILRDGRVVESGAIRNLLRGEVLRTEITLAHASDALLHSLATRIDLGGHHSEGSDSAQTPVGGRLCISHRADVVVIEVEGEKNVGDVLREALAAGADVVEVAPRRETLEDLFLRKAL